MNINVIKYFFRCIINKVFLHIGLFEGLEILIIVCLVLFCVLNCKKIDKKRFCPQFISEGILRIMKILLKRTDPQKSIAVNPVDVGGRKGRRNFRRMHESLVHLRNLLEMKIQKGDALEQEKQKMTQENKMFPLQLSSNRHFRKQRIKITANKANSARYSVVTPCVRRSRTKEL